MKSMASNTGACRRIFRVAAEKFAPRGSGPEKSKQLPNRGAAPRLPKTSAPCPRFDPTNTCCVLPPFSPRAFSSSPSFGHCSFRRITDDSAATGRARSCRLPLDRSPTPANVPASSATPTWPTHVRAIRTRELAARPVTGPLLPTQKIRLCRRASQIRAPSARSAINQTRPGRVPSRRSCLRITPILVRARRAIHHTRRGCEGE